MAATAPTIPTFDRKLAQLLLAASSFAYSASDDEGFLPGCKLLDQSGTRPLVWRNVRNAFGDTVAVCIIRHTDANIVAFRGTESSVLDWLGNFRAIQTPFCLNGRRYPGLVHQGFLHELQQVWDPICEQVKSLDNRKPLYVTGHSQGGAIAVLLMAALVAEGIPVSGCYTFAAPRLGDPALAMALAEQNIHRVEFSCDIVPHVPRELPTVVRTAIAKRLSQKGWLGKMLDRVSGADVLSRQLLRFFARIESAAYSPVGRLTWIEGNGHWHTGLADNDERRLAASRLLQIATAGRRIADHHRISSYEAVFRNL